MNGIIQTKSIGGSGPSTSDRYSYILTKKGKIKTAWLNPGDNISLDKVPITINTKSRLSTLSVSNSKIATFKLAIYRNGIDSINIVKEWIITNASSDNTDAYTDNIIFEAGDRLSVRIIDESSGTNPKNPVVTITLRTV